MLKIKGLYKSYKDKQVLRGVDLSVEKGAITGLIGVNGAGKSTLIECVCGVKKIDSGEILINGINIIDKKHKKEIKKIIGYMPQNFSMFNDLTVEENLGYLCSVYGVAKDNVERVINLCNLNDQKSSLAKNLSGGYRQLLSMACAVIHSPDFLILDEPTSSMDPVFRRKFWQVVNECKNKNITVLVITHYMEELIECDNFVCLAGGKVAFYGTLNQYKQEGMLNIEEILKKYTIEE